MASTNLQHSRMESSRRMLNQELVNQGEAAEASRRKKVKARKKLSAVERREVANKGEHESGSIAADRKEQLSLNERKYNGNFVSSHPHRESGIRKQS